MPSPLPAPLLAEEERFARLRLIRSARVGVLTFRRLLAEHGSALRALEALPALAAASGARDYRPAGAALARAEIAAGRAAGARLLFEGEPDYPRLLAEIPDAPPLLWALGDISLLTKPLVALVGARNASSLGIRMARRLAGALAEAGFPVVSGLARGIDTAAHEAALPHGTIAVQAGGIDVIYPRENTDLAARIGASGLRLSEQPPGMQPLARHFPQRNRIVSGLSHAVVVVEAAPRSGSLITARNALDQGREVMAVPGHPLDERAGGCNLLIREGALLVRGVEDVIAALPGQLPCHGKGVPRLPDAPICRARPDLGARSPRPAGDLSAPARDNAPLPHLILDRLSRSPVPEDQVLRDLGISVGEGAPALLSLELEGRVLRHPGGLLSRA
ncbi:DNA-processing protein DprA [Haematobacter genomosp. 1]|uniref:DNA-protecting protein DprA n=2 Tax=Haematobacter genomosp. 1 TaxID=366618 RepID=A0A212A875_9RHOB|nr:DNA-processing protein DprA [Haematobacter genomosp. 1]OWJ75589.1 DNA-protecting protein DprA [Haematobacter genomosp. 1]